MPDAVLALCSEDREARAVVDRLTSRGLRVIAVASRSRHDESVPEQRSDAEGGVRLRGPVALEDPRRTELLAALAACRSAGLLV